jgi:hypothetical protein
LSWNTWLRLALGFALVTYAVLGHVNLVTPVGELPEILPVVARNAFAGAPVPHECAPCGCSASSARAADAAYCVGDEELRFLSSLDVPLTPPASTAEAATARSFLRDRMSTRECYAELPRMHAALASTPTAAARGHVLWHWYVRPDLRADLTISQLDMIAAWMGSQDMERSMLVVWSPAPSDPPPSLLAYARLFPGRVRWRSLDLVSEAEATPLRRSYLLHLRDAQAWADSDIARLVILHRYGGVWMDTDLLLTRSLTPLLGLQFATEFSCDHGQSGFNNAIMRFFARGRAITALCEAALSKWPRLRQWTFGPHALAAAYDAGAPFLRLPWCFFHGRWCEGALEHEMLAGSQPWPAAYLADSWGLHLHGAGARREGKDEVPVVNTSILGVYEGVGHAALLAKVEAGDPTGEAARRWRRERTALMLFPQPYKTKAPDTLREA